MNVVHKESIEASATEVSPKTIREILKHPPQQAIEELDRLGAEGYHMLGQAIEHKRTNDFAWPLLCMGTLSGLLGLFTLEAFHALFLFSMGFFLAGSAGCYFVYHSSFEEGSLLSLLPRIQNPHAIPMLLNQLDRKPVHLSKVAAEVLVRLIPRLPEISAHLSPAQRDTFQLALDRLDRTRYGDLMAALITALAQAGDTSILEPVYRLAYTDASSPRGQIVREAARDALPKLEAAENWQAVPLEKVMERLPRINPETLAISSPSVRDLLRLRYQLTADPEEYMSLAPTHQDLLMHYIQVAYNRMPASRWEQEAHTEAACAVLDAVGRTLDATKLEPIYHIAHSAASTPHRTRIRTAARDTLSRLEASIEWGGVERLPKLLSLLSHSTEAQSQAQLLRSGLALKHILPHVTAEQYQTLKPEDKKTLHNMARFYIGELLYPIYPTYPAELFNEALPAVIEMFGRVGDTRAYTTLRRIAFSDAPTTSQKRIREAARTARRLLEPRVAREKVGATLLRASDAPNAAPAELLRAANDTGTTPHEQLLRAGNANQE